MIRERKNCHLLLLPGSEPSRGTARLHPGPPPAPHPSRLPGAAVAPRSLHFVVSSWQMQSWAGAETLPCFKGIWSCPGGKGSPLPTESTTNMSTRTEVSLPDAFVFSCLPPSLASHVTLRMGNNQRKVRPRGEDPSTQKSEPPLLLSGVGGTN